MRIDKQVDHYVNCCWVNDLYRFTTIVYLFVLSHTHTYLYLEVFWNQLMTAEGLWCCMLTHHILIWYQLISSETNPWWKTTNHLSLQAWQAWLRAWGVSRPQFIAIWAIKKTMFSPPMKFVAKWEPHWLWVMIVLNKAFSITPLTKKRMYHGMIKPTRSFWTLLWSGPFRNINKYFFTPKGHYHV